ncbi:marine proteobacterial sortase target protein [Limihaloglobus sulfuriphilus]|uniref:Marine proteobacterial sortase target protein n=1 Tax=Limihaloglobus sulfuriphilus TaxID=1851148 RepID=A0A1Q2MCI0_9BACT|nr:VWA domain-containing protein [Limihaloglobus sulfuriphilus]AQQ70380.1 marine proteobacterial sortase target protein [Limihaloglobus sulfuriphilus]
MAVSRRKFSPAKAIIVSAAVHGLILIVFCFITFSRADSPGNEIQTPQANIEHVRRIINSRPVMPKPSVKKRTFTAKRPVKRDISARSLVTRSDTDSTFSSDEEPQITFSDLGGDGMSDIEFFGNRASASNVCFVVDGSGSMLGLTHSVKKQLISSVKRLNAGNHIYLIVFSGDGLLTTANDKMVRASAAAVSQTVEMVNALPMPSGSPKALSALKKAFELTSHDGGKPDVIYFLTDGFDYSDSANRDFTQTVMRLRNEIAPNTRIHTIGFWSGVSDSEMLRQIAENTGGKFSRFMGDD